MAVFAYDPALAKNWANEVVNYLNGGSESFHECSRKFSEQIEALVQPNVWTGAAAAKNYQNFLETHQAMINFINAFGDAFQNAMNSINQNIASLEVANLGADTNVSTAFGTLSYDQLSALSEENINKEVVRYDYAAIVSIGGVLNNIYTTLQTVNTNLTNKINELNSGASIWDGDAAGNARDELSNTLNTNMTKVFENLNICINNIKTAGEAAQVADQG